MVHYVLLCTLFQKDGVIMAKVRTQISAKAAGVIRRVVAFTNNEQNAAALVQEFGVNIPDFQKSLLQMHGRTAGGILDNNLSDEQAARRLVSKFVGVADGTVKVSDLADELGIA